MKMIVTENGIIDLEITSTGLSIDSSLQSAVIISLFTDRRADDDDKLPSINNNGVLPPDKKGWVGDILDDKGRLIGSRLWLLDREKQTEETRLRAIEYAEEALQWILDDGRAVDIKIYAGWGDLGRMDMKIEIYLIDGSTYSLEILKDSGVIYAI